MSGEKAKKYKTSLQVHSLGSGWFLCRCTCELLRSNLLHCSSRRRQRENWFIFYTWSFFLPPLLLDVTSSVMTSGLTYFDIQSSLTIVSLAIWLLHIHDLKHSLYFKISLSHFLPLYVLYDLSYMFHLVYATLLEMNLCVGHSHKEILTWSIFNSNTEEYFHIFSSWLCLSQHTQHNLFN